MVAIVAALTVLAGACSGDGPPDAFGGSTVPGTSIAEASTIPPSTIGAGAGAGAGAGDSAVPATSETAGSGAPTSTDTAGSPPTTPGGGAGAVTTNAPTGSPTTLAPAATSTTAAPTPDQVQQAVAAYTLGTPGPADAVNGTYGIGWINQEGGSPSFPDATTGLAAAVDYVNRNLGGIGGRVLELHTCAIQKAADGSRCAQQMKDDPAVSVVLVGAVAVGNTELLGGLQGAKPVVLANPITTADYLATDAVSFQPGAPGIIAGLTRFAATGLAAGPPTKVAVVYPLGLAGEAAYQLLAKPVLDRLGITAIPVAVIEASDPSKYAPVITAAGAADAQAFIPILGGRGCVGIDQALRDLASSAAVLATDACLGASMNAQLLATARTGVLPEGWYIGGSGFRFGIAGSPAQDTYLQVISEYLARNSLPLVDVTRYAATSFAAALTVVRLANQLGPDGATTDAMRAATRGFAGPMWDVAGPMSCGFNPFYPSLCGTQMGVERYSAGAFTPVADAYTGASVSLVDAAG